MVEEKLSLSQLARQRLSLPLSPLRTTEVSGVGPQRMTLHTNYSVGRFPLNQKHILTTEVFAKSSIKSTT